MNAIVPEPMMIRVAGAIAAGLGSPDWAPYLAVARSALEEMREPTTGMLEAATRGLPDWGHLPDEWRKMIDFALEEEVGWLNTMLDKPSGCQSR